jgi:hypothetical protein
MGLRAQAAADLRSILEDSTAGFGWPITITNPAGATASLTGFTNDISKFTDPSTGMMVGGRSTEISIPIAALVAAGLGQPDNIDDSASKPWVVAFNDVQGNAYTFKVCDASPDATLGVVVCSLEAYKP